MSAEAQDWFVSDGAEVYGPMPRARLTEAIEQGALAPGAWARRADWDAWRKVDDVPELQAGEASGIRRTSDAMVVARELAAVIAAPTLRDAAVHVMVIAAQHLGCAAALVHVAAPGGREHVTSGALGPKSATVVGSTVATGDAVLKELARERAVRAHKKTRARLDALGAAGVTDAIALPLRARGELVGAIELAADDRRGPFEPRDVAFVEQLAAGLSLAPR